ncbi:molybdopterin-dependent oxidoreductase [Actinotalea sp. JY-7876]|uniref:molybdopterin-dependent oxidoreductase n=2 Tax=unclassified Actinotalea TaxID=2638618 RepID=UPI0015F37DC6|nr:molybdopterin-dependent oxidoreductase [Actinotalea sp. JY-7876]
MSRRAVVAGLLAAALTLGVAQLVAALLPVGAAPLTAVGDAFIDVTPGWLKDLAIGAFGTADKTALVVAMVLVLAVVAAATGLLAVRSPVAASAVVLAIGVLGGVVAAGRPGNGVAAALPSVVGGVAGALALRMLAERITRASPDDGRMSPGAPASADVSPGPDRRGFLAGALTVAVVAALTAAAGTVAGSTARTVARAREALRLPPAARRAAPVPAGAQSPVPGVVDVVTGNGAFYRIDTALVVPQVDPATWRLRVHGMVEREVTLALDELLAEDLVEAHVTLACVSNPVGGDLVGTALWLGLPVRALLERAGPLPGADMVLSTSADGFTASTPLPVLLDDRDALLAVGMNGDPLPAAHGFPVRMVVPGLFGYVSATKWLTDLEVTRFADREAYWTARGWSAEGPVKTASRIEVPRRGAVVAAGDVGVGGTAWAQHRGITGVEVQVDDGPWEAATLADEISVDTWRQWSWTWAAEPGRHVLRVRAADPDGVQTGRRADVVPDGATGWHEVDVEVRG